MKLGRIWFAFLGGSLWGWDIFQRHWLATVNPCFASSTLGIYSNRIVLQDIEEFKLQMSRAGVLIDCWWRCWAGNCRPFLTHARNLFRCTSTSTHDTDDTVHRTPSFQVSSHPPNIKNRDVPHLRQNVLQLFAVFMTSA